MAKIVHDLVVNNTRYDLGTVHYIVGTGTTAGTWLGSDSSIQEYYDGLTIAYKLNVAGASTTTLNINGLGAKTVYRGGTTKLTTQYSVNSVVLLTYTTTSSTGCWQCAADYDSNTKVTSAANHYTPATDTASALSVDASGGSAATWGTTQLVTGVNLERDSKGHVTGLSVDSIKMPSNPNTTYTAGTGLSLSGTKFNHSNSVTAGTAGTSTATSGSTLAVPYVTYDAQGHITASGTHTHTVTGFATTAQGTKADNALPKSGGTVTGNITMDNSASSQSGEPYLQWATVGSNKPYTGFAHDQTDGTFIICSMEKDTTTNGVKYYRNGLAISGGSGNLFWKGVKVATVDDIPSNSYHTTGSWSGLTYTATAQGGAGALAFTIPTGTTATTVAIGNHTHSSYVNQNAFSNVKVGSTTISADSATDTLTLAAGSNITLTPDATNDKVTISASSTEYTVSVPTTGWTTDSTYGNKVTITVSGVTANSNPIADVVLNGSTLAANKTLLEQWSCISKITTAANSVTLYAFETVPTTAFSILMKFI